MVVVYVCPNTLELENKQLSSNHGNLESVFLSIQRVSEILDEVSWGKLLPTFFLRRKKKKKVTETRRERASPRVGAK